MNRVEFAANLAAAAATAFGAGLVHADTLSIHDARDAREQLLDDRAAVIQEYREENPDTTTVPVEIEDAYAPKLEKASDRLDAERAESWKGIGVTLGGLALLGGTVAFTVIRSRRRTSDQIGRLYDRIETLTDCHTALLNRYRDRYVEDANFGLASSPYDARDTSPFQAIPADVVAAAQVAHVEHPAFAVVEKSRPAVSTQPEFVVQTPRPQHEFTVERPAPPRAEPTPQPKPTTMPPYPQPAAAPRQTPPRRGRRGPQPSGRRKQKGIY